MPAIIMHSAPTAGLQAAAGGVFMRWRLATALFSFVLLHAAAALAQDFGVLESAETITRGNFKFGAYPMFVFPDPGDTTFQLGVAFGGGLTNSLDLEGRAAFGDQITYVGADAEYWLVKNRPLDLSVRGGFHFGFPEGDIGDTAGVDLSVLGS